MEFNNNSDFDFLVPSKTLSQFSFDADFAEGHEGEKYVKNVLSQASIEVKRDKWAARSGNLCLEFQSRGKPSGIAVTKADFWCFVVADKHVVMFPTDFLKWVHKKNLGTVRWGGDRDSSGKPTSGFRLLAWNELMSFFNLYNSSKANENLYTLQDNGAVSSSQATL